MLIFHSSVRRLQHSLHARSLLPDDYFDSRSSPHRTIIPIGDKVAKQHRRPAEAIEAERRRVEAADIAAAADGDGAVVKDGKRFVEHVEVAGE